VLGAASALALARADVAYLDALAAAAGAAGQVETLAAAVAPPRAPIADFAVYDPHRTNAAAAVAEARAAPRL
jgi:hypothetical protein